MIQCQQVSKRYKQHTVLHPLDLTIHQGRCLGIIGPNGAGKSTFIKLIARLIEPSSGRILFKNHSTLSYVSQQLCLEPTMTVRDHLQLFGEILQLSKATIVHRRDELLQQLQLVEKQHALISTLSGGMKRRVHIACALMNAAPFIILDEPTVGIDLDSKQTILTLIQQLKQKGATIIYTSHHMDEIEKICDDILFLQRGQVIEQLSLQTLFDKYQQKGVYLELDGNENQQIAFPPEWRASPVQQGWFLPHPEPLVRMTDVIKWQRITNIPIRQLSIHRSTMDQIFFTLFKRGERT